jgi:hypothetical protein
MPEPLRLKCRVRGCSVLTIWKPWPCAVPVAASRKRHDLLAVQPLHVDGEAIHALGEDQRTEVVTDYVFAPT